MLIWWIDIWLWYLKITLKNVAYLLKIADIGHKFQILQMYTFIWQSTTKPVWPTTMSTNHKIGHQLKIQSCFGIVWNSSRRLKFPLNWLYCKLALKIKFIKFWEGHKNLKKIFCFALTFEQVIIKKWKIFSNCVACSQYANFTHLHKFSVLISPRGCP